jgi:hypothetical protein
VSDRFDRYIQGKPAIPNLGGSKAMQEAGKHIEEGMKEGLESTEAVDLAGRPAPPEGHTYLYTELEVELARLLNRHSAENESGTPDHILADYLIECLKTFNKIVGRRAQWRGEHTELPALHDIRSGVRTVPMVVTSPNRRMMNDIGQAKITITPGEQVPPIGRIERVIAVYEPEPDE